MLPALLCRLFGANWKTSVSALVSVAAGFVAFSPDLFTHFPAVVEIAKYIALGGVASLGITAADKPK